MEPIYEPQSPFKRIYLYFKKLLGKNEETYFKPSFSQENETLIADDWHLTDLATAMKNLSMSCNECRAAMGMFAIAKEGYYGSDGRNDRE